MATVLRENVPVQLTGNSLLADLIDIGGGISVFQLKIRLDGESVVVGNVANDSLDSGNPVKTGGVYNVTQPTLEDADRGDTQMDSRANTLVNLATKLDPTNDSISVGGSSSVIGLTTNRQTALSNADVAIKTGPGNLYKVTIDNTANGAVTYVHLYDEIISVVIVGTTIPKWSWPVLANSILSEDLLVPISCLTAITVAATTTAAGSTAPGVAILAEFGYV